MPAIVRVPADRQPSQLRPIVIQTGVNAYAEGSALIQCGSTHVLCTASVENKVPDWMKGKGTGWITAEYSMLPRSTHTRTKRDREKVSGRTQEIQRLIGRALRAMVDLKALGERTVTLDCDVLQADGGTRTASITGACVALALALHKVREAERLPRSPWVDTVSAVSVGLKGGVALTDLDYAEDSTCDVDMNFVVTGAGLLVEVQGTAEKTAFARADLDRMTDAALVAAALLRDRQLDALRAAGTLVGLEAR